MRYIDEAGFGSFDICFCSSLLYHMQGSANLLVRIGKVSRHLMLERINGLILLQYVPWHGRVYPATSFLSQLFPVSNDLLRLASLIAWGRHAPPIFSPARSMSPKTRMIYSNVCRFMAVSMDFAPQNSHSTLSSFRWCEPHGE
jgi:hypothetical protein